ncbi:MAG: redoxin domain-containing protein [Burkholderiales bacterium]
MFRTKNRRSYLIAGSLGMMLAAAALFSVQASADDRVLGPVAPLIAAKQWLNTPRLTAEMLRGKVVLVDFWTYSCGNCLNALPSVKLWDEKYRAQGLVVIGVHTPEFPAERDRQSVEQAVKRLGVVYPVVLDNQYEIWNAYANKYWPAQYLIDAQGQLRFQHYGEGAYQEIELNIQTLLKEARPGSSVTLR